MLHDTSGELLRAVAEPAHKRSTSAFCTSSCRMRSACFGFGRALHGNAVQVERELVPRFRLHHVADRRAVLRLQLLDFRADVWVLLQKFFCHRYLLYLYHITTNATAAAEKPTKPSTTIAFTQRSSPAILSAASVLPRLAHHDALRERRRDYEHDQDYFSHI